ncbi:MAG: proton-conducting transporter membrane subunit, partial [Actinomycetota bacterium]|nr:proton-conducting transporter membrane subunit [Actinomycetota bacterium]
MTAFSSPVVDFHALAPELVLAAGICVVLLVDLFVPDNRRWITGTLSGFFMLGALLPLATLAVLGDDVRSAISDGAAGQGITGRYVVDNFALALKALFLLSGYVVVLLSTHEMEDGKYYQGEYYVLLLSSVLGMVMMASSRDLVSVFVALEFLSIPAYMMAAWNKRDRKSNEAGVKYYLLGVFASAVMLYGMSLLYGIAGSTKLTDIGAAITLEGDKVGVQVVGVVFVIV